jgi:uroporphyrinogen decarboxylase
MPLDQSKFPKAKKDLLSREEVKALIKGKGNTRPAQCITPVLYLPSEQPFRQKEMEQIIEEYPDDAVFFEYTRPKNFGKPGDRYVWCDVADADPLLHKKEDEIGIDEKTALEWEVIEQISADVPDPYFPKCLVQDYFEDDGRYRGIFWTRLSFERLWHFRGMTNTLMDFYTNPDEVKALLLKLRNIIFKVIDRSVDEYHFDAIAFTDDIGMQDRPFFSEDIFLEFIKPHYKEVIDYAHTKGMDVWLHTCGNVEPFIPHMIEIGLDVLHPIQKYSMDEEKIIEQYRDQICFWAGMEVQRILPFGSPEDVRQEMRFLIDTFYLPNKGRLVLASGNRFRHDIPTENIRAFFEELYIYGSYVAKHGVSKHESPAKGHTVLPDR